jgi:tetratricopeptide (TPR) repeat protein
LLVCCLLTWLVTGGLAYAAVAARAHTVGAGVDGQIAAASEAEIAARIALLQAERERRLAALLPPERQAERAAERFVPGLLQDPQTWMVGLSAMLGLSLACLVWLFLMTRRIKQRECQANPMADWDEGMSRRISVVNSQPSQHENAGYQRPRRITSDPQGLMAQQAAYEAEAARTALASAHHFERNPDVIDAISVVEETEPYSQAQFWAALGKLETAIEILEQCHEQDYSPNSWLLLFDLYRQTGARESYEGLQRNFKCIFNASIPAWDENWDAPPRLKDRPDLMQRINRALSSNNVLAYLEELLLDKRGGTRRGFEFGVYRDLVQVFDAICAGKVVPNCEAVCQ